MAPLLALPLGYLLWFHFAFEPTRTGFEALALPAVVGFTWLLIHEILMFVSAPQGYYTFSKRLDYGHWGLVVASIVLAAFPFLI